MKKSFKSFVRAISPFTKKKSNESDDGSEGGFSNYDWDLDNVDLKISLKAFYKKYNPEKTYIVNEILSKYENDEILLLRNLCERYNLSQDDMQYFLDLGFKEGSVVSNANKRRPSLSSVASSRQGGSEDKRSQSSTRDVLRYSNYTWDINNVDISSALQMLYKRYNPTKAPNLAALKDKNEDEIIVLLRQLCKRHQLTQSDMQFFLDRARNEPPPEEAPPAPPTRRQSQARRYSNYDPTGSSTPQQQQQQYSYDSVDVSPLSMDSRIAKQLRSDDNQSLDRMLNEINIEDDLENENQNGYHQSSSNQFAKQAPPPPPPSKRAPEMPPAPPAPPRPPAPPAPGAQAPYTPQTLYPSSQSKSNVPFSASNPESEDLQERIASMKGFRPLLPDGKRFTLGPVLREMKTSQGQYEAPIPVPEPETYSSYPNISNNSHNFQSNESVDVANKEIDTLRNELEVARHQITAMSQESSEVLKLLKESNMTMTDYITNQKANKEASSPAKPKRASKGIQVEDHEAKSTLNKLNSKIQQEEEFTRKLQSTLAEKDKNINQYEKNINKLQIQLRKCQSDKTDLLQLLNILSVAPIPAKNVLESYLTKLAGDTPKGSELREKVVDAKSLPMGDRIDNLLIWKRKKEEEMEESDPLFLNDGSVVGGNDFQGSDEDNEAVDSDADISPRAKSKSPSKSGQSKNNSNQDFQIENPMLSSSELSYYRNLNVNTNSKPSSSRLPGSRSASPAPSTLLDRSKDVSEQFMNKYAGTKPDDKHDLLTEQYELAKQFYVNQRSQVKLSEKIAKKNLALQEIETEQALKDTLKKTEALDQGIVKPNIEVVEVEDWIECVDAKTQRKYYYSASLRKSIWNKPPGFKVKDLEEESISTTGIRQPSPILAKHALSNYSFDSSNENEIIPSTSKLAQLTKTKTINSPSLSIRSESPIGPLRSTTGDTSLNPSRSSSRSQSTNRNSSDNSSAWIEAFDPKSKRKYWYNRETGKSTWRRPAELI